MKSATSYSDKHGDRHDLSELRERVQTAHSRVQEAVRELNIALAELSRLDGRKKPAVQLLLKPGGKEKTV